MNEKITGKRILPCDRTGLMPFHKTQRQLIKQLNYLDYDDQILAMRITDLLFDFDLVQNNQHWNLKRLDMAKTHEIAPMILECYKLLINSFQIDYDADTQKESITIDSGLEQEFRQLFNKVINHKDFYRALSQINSNKRENIDINLQVLVNWVVELRPIGFTYAKAIKAFNNKFSEKSGKKISRDSKYFKEILRPLLDGAIKNQNN